MSTTFNARLLGETEKAANAILMRLLAEPGLTEPQWVTLSLTAVGEGTLDRAQLEAQVAGALHVDGARATALLSSLVDAGLIDDGADTAVTDAGLKVFTGVRAATAQVTERLWGDVAAGDLEVTARVLSTILERANAELSGA